MPTTHVVITRSIVAVSASVVLVARIPPLARGRLVTQGVPPTPGKVIDISGRATVHIPKTPACARGGPRVGVVRDIAVDAVTRPAHAPIYASRAVLAVEKTILAAPRQIFHRPKVAILTVPYARP